MDFIQVIMTMVVYVAPFIILYFVVAAAVKKGIDSSQAGRALVEKLDEKASRNGTNKK
ncbi:hypothetical protein [Virgibacillus profundi]|uniref:hypothetical protein n=1 Tax=Virgibacillus profundi TaxID=2024555 RepID=UPI0013FD97A6|nr:hypothetical protein [Virgibacillus profundi]